MTACRHRAWRSGRAEGIVQSKISKLQQTLETMKRRRAEEAEAEARQRLLLEAEELRDARGREVYGDAWDNPQAGKGAPLRDLFALTEMEVQLLEREAQDIIEAQGRAKAKTLEASRPPPPKLRSKPRLPELNFSALGRPLMANPLKGSAQVGVQSAVALFRAAYFTKPRNTTPRVYPELSNDGCGVSEEKHGRQSPREARIAPSDASGQVIVKQTSGREHSLRKISPRIVPVAGDGVAETYTQA